MLDITTKFKDFKSKKIDNFNKDKEFQPLSDDIIALSKLDNGEYEKIKGPIDIVQITGILTDEDEIKKLEEAVGIPPVSMDLSLKEVKRGQEIWATALLKKPESAVYNTNTVGLLKLRIVDIYFGLSKLSTLR